MTEPPGANRDSASLKLIGGFFAILGSLVLLGAFWAIGNTAAVAVNLLAGGTLIGIGVLMLWISRRMAK